VDNLTHSLVGVVSAEAVLRASGQQKVDRRFCHWAWLVSFAANNFADLDYFYAFISGKKLGYLLHHRGHTHTLLGILPQALLVGLGSWCLMKLAGVKFQRSQWNILWGLIFLGLGLHVGLDSLNSYGVHPFWPWDNRWFYADSFFIIEPVLWIGLIVSAAFLTDIKGLKVAFLLMGFVAVGIVWYAPVVHPVIALGVTAFFLGAMLLCYWLPHLALSLGIGTMLMMLGINISLSRVMRQQLYTSWKSHFESVWEIHDLVIHPYPANPLCWNYVLVARDESQRNIRLERGNWAIWPKGWPVSSCEWFNRSSTAPLSAQAPWHHPNQLFVEGVMTLSRAQLKALNATHCEFEAFLRYARVPFFLDRDSSWVIGDLRYDREAALGFAEMQVGKTPGQCPKWLPPWIKPTEALLKD